MQYIRELIVGLILFGSAVGSLARAQDVQDIKLEVVKFDGLCKVVNEYKGKVVVVDFWSNTCLPCLKGFPKIVKLHNKYASQGLQIVTVSTNAPTAQEKETAKQLLAKFKMPTRNLLLDENSQVMLDKLRLKSVPCLYIFNRDGKWRQFASGISPQQLEELIRAFLEEK